MYGYYDYSHILLEPDSQLANRDLKYAHKLRPLPSSRLLSGSVNAHRL
jgi:hypothetical protein